MAYERQIQILGGQVVSVISLFLSLWLLEGRLINDQHAIIIIMSNFELLR